ncbi:MAG: phosphoribosylanthranilate isomerase [Saprospiraceae bacterium]
MLIKICGLKYADNIRALGTYPIDMMGFIFYPKSPRFIDGEFEISTIKYLPNDIKKVGVFVNQSFEEILSKQLLFQLDFIQLHGDENEQFCKRIKDLNMGVIKAFQIDENFDFSILKKYQELCDYYLFDTKTSGYGGSGKAFDWSILNQYALSTPFLLSGGIGLENIDEALSFYHSQLAGFDINSKIELEPGLKSIEMTKNITIKIKN